MANLYLFLSDNNVPDLPAGTQYRIAAIPPGPFMDSGGNVCGVFQTPDDSPVDGFETVLDDQLDALGDIDGWDMPYDVVPDPPSLDGFEDAITGVCKQFGVVPDDVVSTAMSVKQATQVSRGIKINPIGPIKVGG